MFPRTGDSERDSGLLDIDEKPGTILGKGSPCPFAPAEITRMAIQLFENNVVFRKRAKQPVGGQYLQPLWNSGAILAKQYLATNADAHVVWHIEHFGTWRFEYQSELFELGIVLPDLAGPRIPATGGCDEDLSIVDRNPF